MIEADEGGGGRGGGESAGGQSKDGGGQRRKRPPLTCMGHAGDTSCVIACGEGGGLFFTASPYTFSVLTTRAKQPVFGPSPFKRDASLISNEGSQVSTV